MKVSVIMPVYNGEKYLKEAIDSVLNQSFSDFELIVINDASKDGSENIIKTYKDSRIRHIKNTENKGLVGVLNIGIEESIGLYIARMDQDDICYKNRLKSQVELLDQYHEIGVCGTGGVVFGEKKFKMPILESPEKIAIEMLFNCPLIHPSVMLRKEILNKHSLFYDSQFSHAEDYDFWSELIKYTKIYNIPKVLIKYRWHNTNYSSIKSGEQKVIANNIRLKYLKEQFKFDPSEIEKETHKKLCESDFVSSEKDIMNIQAWLLTLSKCNQKTKKFDQALFNQSLSFYWEQTIINSYPFLKCLKVYNKKTDVDNLRKNKIRFCKSLMRKLIKKLLKNE